jgi:excisionase family DNA binding protein
MVIPLSPETPPTPQEQQVAREAELRLRRLLESNLEGEELPQVALQFRLAQSDAPLEVVALPLSALRLLDAILEANANGHAVTVMPSHGELTPNQAAEMLGVSRPFLIRLLDEGQIPFRRVGAHRRIRIDALEKYRSAEEERQLGVLAQLQAQAQELNMGY